MRCWQVSLLSHADCTLSTFQRSCQHPSRLLNAHQTVCCVARFRCGSWTQLYRCRQLDRHAGLRLAHHTLQHSSLSHCPDLLTFGHCYITSCRKKTPSTLCCTQAFIRLRRWQTCFSNCHVLHAWPRAPTSTMRHGQACLRVLVCNIMTRPLDLLPTVCGVQWREGSASLESAHSNVQKLQS